MMCFVVNCVHQPQTKRKRHCEDAAEAGQSVIINTETGPAPTGATMLLCKDEVITPNTPKAKKNNPDDSLQMFTGTKASTFKDIAETTKPFKCEWR